MKLAIPVTIALAATSSAALAQSPQIFAAIEKGRVGERFDGYMGFAEPATDEVRRQVIGINIQRRSLYTQIAAQRGVTIELVGLTTACALFRSLPVGEAYLLEDKVWRRRAAGAAPPSPDHCR